MKCKIIYLKPKSTYKTHLRSDTLWGHLCWAIRHIYGKAKLEEFIATSPFVISSVFPYLEIDGEKVAYFPKPVVKKNTTALQGNFLAKKAAMAERKKKKKVGALLPKDKFTLAIHNRDKEYEVSEKDPVPKEGSLAVTHNRIDRLKGGTLSIHLANEEKAGQLFHIEENYLKQKNAGLFFLAKGEDYSLLEGALRYLNHMGLGGKRGTGKGAFEISEPSTYEIEEPKDANFMMTLSLYHPQDDEIGIMEQFVNDERFAYHLEDRQGRVGFMNYSEVRKNAFMFFKEGSVVPLFDKSDIGVTLDNVAKAKNIPHKVNHYGKGFMIKVKR